MPQGTHALGINLTPMQAHQTYLVQPPPISVPPGYMPYLPVRPVFDLRGYPVVTGLGPQGVHGYTMPMMPMLTHPSHQQPLQMQPSFIPQGGWIPMYHYGMPPAPSAMQNPYSRR
jgi:hypothetical protein